ncbi:MAG: hypothetical protein IT317_22385 [Anaerolineales bacterium]|nr:hypothetical protein [Anaerolineales bacterium]
MPPRRPWPVTALAWLLLLQAAGLTSLAALAIGPFTARLPLPPDWFVLPQLAPVRGLVCALIALLAVAAAFGFFRVAPGAWVNAVLAQGLMLLVALILYFRERPGYVYLLMLYGLFMVLYLHQADVQAAFRRDLHPHAEIAGPVKHHLPPPEAPR